MIDRCEHINYATATGLYGGVLYTGNDPVYYYGPDWPCEEPAALKVEASRSLVQTGGQIVFRVVAYTASGIPWDVSQQTTFEISPAAQGNWTGNVYTGGAVGTWVVTGNYGGLSGSVTIEVTRVRIWFPLVFRSAVGSTGE